MQFASKTQNIARNAAKVGVRHFTKTTATEAKVAVIGAAGGIGQPLSLLMKASPHVDELALFDVVNTPGVAADISHCSTNASVTGHTGNDEIGECLTGCDVVIIPAGVPRKPGMTRDDLFNTNASIVAGLAENCAKYCPDASFCIISNPVNSTVPIFAEVLKNAGVYNKKKLFGVTTLDVVRARTFVAENQDFDVDEVDVTVIGGHAGTTILPLLSQVDGANFSEDDLAALTHRIQFGGDEVVQAKDGAGSATLSMAFAGAEFAELVLRAQEGEENIVACTFVENDLTDAPFFSTPCLLGPDGVAEVYPFGDLTEFEQEGLNSMLPDLVAQAQKGVDFVKNN
jgi:malate dehydrogenase